MKETIMSAPHTSRQNQQMAREQGSIRVKERIEMRIRNYINSGKDKVFPVLATKTPGKIVITLTLGVLVLTTVGISLGITNGTEQVSPFRERPAVEQLVTFPELEGSMVYLEEARNTNALP